MLDSLSSALLGLSPVVIGGVFNAWAVKGGSRLTNARGCALLEAMATLNVDVANVGDRNINSMNVAEFIIDVTLGTLVQTLVDDGGSSHLAIRYTVEHGGRRPHLKVIERHRGGRTSGFDKQAFMERLLMENNADDLAMIYSEPGVGHVTPQCQGDPYPEMDANRYTGGVEKSQNFAHLA